MVLINGLEIHPNEDGESHVNAYSSSLTELGKMLSNFFYLPTITPDGHFDSLEGYYHYLKIKLSLERTTTPIKDHSKLEYLRYVSGRDAQCVGRNIRKELMREGVFIYDKPNEVFTARFKIALKNKIVNDKTLYDLLMCNNLPIVHYYTYGTDNASVYHHKRFNWLSDLITELELELKGLV